MSEGQNASPKQDNFKIEVLAKADPARLPEVLADLSPIEYDLLRKPFAEKLGVRPTALDETRNLERRRRGGNGVDDGGQGEDLNIDDPEPWDVPVDGAKLLNELAFTFRRYAVLPTNGDKVLALWVVHTYAYDYRDCTPILGLTSPQKRCGKTTVIGLLSELVSRALPASNITSAGVFRVISKYKPTLLIDEADTFLGDNEELRGVLNCGHTRKLAYVVRPVGEAHDPKRFSAWAPKALALIGKLPSTLADRSINITMQRRLPGERIQKANHFDGLTLRRKCVKWVDNYHPWIAEADPRLPPSLNDRAADNWRPLVALADLAGGRWPKRARQAALAFGGDQEDESAAILLLSDLRDLFTKRETDRLSSDEIVEHLIKLDDRPWPEWGRSRKPITKNTLAALLKPFKVKPKQLWISGRNDRGYDLRALKKVFGRYLPPEQTDRTLEPNNDAGSSDFGSVGKEYAPSDSDPHKASNDTGSSGLAIQKGGAQGNGQDPELLRVLAEACAGLSVTPADLLAKLDPEDYAVVIADPAQARQFAERLEAGRP